MCTLTQVSHVLGRLGGMPSRFWLIIIDLFQAGLPVNSLRPVPWSNWCLIVSWLCRVRWFLWRQSIKAKFMFGKLWDLEAYTFGWLWTLDRSPLIRHRSMDLKLISGRKLLINTHEIICKCFLGLAYRIQKSISRCCCSGLLLKLRIRLLDRRNRCLGWLD